ncbi:levanbiose-producing levanase [Isoptericola jiangsuensis]|uniref:Levanbiose-producing levanase n=1 Tax=Isoptericola jiangsuensis TaxID=548579 RepID=A0A2A9F008_9MICO|nr:glycoside hydrolase family 32 protein [Isoptericola jiangsuensis]PFG44468.1 levanbiose-producing levanase [Isoptericola jiangsuensis]
MTNRNPGRVLAPTLLALALAAPLAAATPTAGAAAPAEVRPTTTTTEATTYRPVYHHSVPDHWKNDPQRPIWVDGELRYHYLYNPDYDEKVGTSWRLTASSDGVVFRDQGVAAAKGTNANYDLWSGSTVVDHDDTAGFGAGAVIMLVTQMDHPTLAEIADASGPQAQFLWYSTDGGRTFRPDGDEPVMANGGRADFRDPKVVWDEERGRWVALVAEADRVSFWTSPDLHAWERVSELVRDDLGMIECPDLFRIRAADGTLHWVLGVSANGYLTGDRATYAYWTGDFDGETFTPDVADPQWLDHGFDWYGAVTWEDRDGSLDRRYAIGWMNSWAYPHSTPTWDVDGFNGTDSIVRELRLGASDDPSGYSLLSRPVAALDDHATSTTVLGDVDVPAGDPVVLDQQEVAYRIETTVSRGTAENVGLQLRRSADGTRHADVGAFFGDDVAYSYLNRGGTVQPDASREKLESRAPLAGAAGSDDVRLTVLVDRTSVEVFVDDGRVVHSSQVFGRPEDVGAALYAVGGTATFRDLTVTTFGDVNRPAARLIADFEGDALPAGWTATGGLSGLAPQVSDLAGQAGHRVLDTFAGADAATGVVTSPPFVVDRRWLRLRVAGGDHPLGVEPATSVNLLLDGRPVRTATGNDDATLRLVEWDLADLQGRTVQLQVLDDATADWGHLVVDHVTLSD